MTQALVLERVTEMGGLNPHHSVRGRRISENWAMDYYPPKKSTNLSYRSLLLLY